MTAHTYAEIHHDASKPPLTRVTFRTNSYDEETAHPWGVLHVDVSIRNGNGGHHMSSTRHFLHGAGWPQQAAAIRQAFRSATLLPNP
jgi:hypothetical protein